MTVRKVTTSAFFYVVVASVPVLALASKLAANVDVEVTVLHSRYDLHAAVTAITYD